MLALFANNLLPVFLVAGAGYLLAWRLRLDPRPVSQLAFFVLAPCLVFRVIVDNELAGEDVLRMTALAATTLLGLGAVAAIVARWLGWPRPLIAAATLVASAAHPG